MLMDTYELPTRKNDLNRSIATWENLLFDSIPPIPSERH